MCSPLTEHPMDLNQLLYNHQIALIRENALPKVHGKMAEHYARKIRCYRRETGLPPLMGWPETGASA